MLRSADRRLSLLLPTAYVIHQYCEGCGIREKTGDSFVQCPGCYIKQYCSMECQKHHQTFHRHVCGTEHTLKLSEAMHWFQKHMASSPLPVIQELTRQGHRHIAVVYYSINSDIAIVTGIPSDVDMRESPPWIALQKKYSELMEDKANVFIYVLDGNGISSNARSVCLDDALMIALQL